MTVSGDPTVRVIRADGDARTGFTPNLERRLDRFRPAVADLLEGVEIAADVDRVTILPDAHYPFHPSSGMVTDPAVVGAVAAAIRHDHPDVDVAVAGASDDRIDFDRTAAYLGYREALERADADADLVDLADGRRSLRTVSDGDRAVDLRIPERLVEGGVVPVPTLRPTEAGTVAGGMRAIARVVGSGGSTVAGSDEDPAAVVGAVRTIDPAWTVVDAATTYGGRPHASDVLLAGPTTAVDALGAVLLDRDLPSDDALSAALEGDDASITVSPIGDVPDLETLRERMPDGELPPADDTHPAVSVAYRLYAAVGNDAVPPQLEARR
ncbi:hypothetical protein C445_16141 [Halobiforma lacisalsi AJ5]|uniref:DUF362 domain-containing protein n=1 Tax=Natronobacterium lacisalsi AJ5 TaxID=358396 RepID=M0LCK9_NATLA|nr:DUF362 domain-containing protein [Halobiforma lacisalsi]EMA30853.1 hypothetical protein C445_16141 [Halobiforma lacisalsi AJ5]